MSLSNKPVGWEEHLLWIRTLDRKNILLYIFEDNHNRPVGTAKIQNGELSYTIAPERRGEGLAAIMLSAVRIKHGPLTCKIKKINTPSIKAAKVAGHVVDLI